MFHTRCLTFFSRYEIMEIKHGRAAMLGFLHVIAIEAGVRLLCRSYDNPAREGTDGVSAIEKTHTYGRVTSGGNGWANHSLPTHY